MQATDQEVAPFQKAVSCVVSACEDHLHGKPTDYDVAYAQKYAQEAGADMNEVIKEANRQFQESAAVLFSASVHS